MVDPRLTDYVNENLKAGYSKEAIKKALTRNGYSADDAENIINSSSSEVISPPAKEKKGNYAGFWLRVSALVWDIIIINIPLAILFSVLMLLAAFIPFLGIILYAMYIIAGPAIFIYFEGIKGGSPGKLILGLQVVKDDGKFIGIGGAIIRFVGKLVSAAILYIGFLMIAWDKKKQGLHDKIASSFVVKTPIAEKRKFLAIMGIVIFFLVPFVMLLFFITIGSVAYFGVLSPDEFLPKKCIISPGISCVTHQALADGTVTLLLRNGMGRDINVESLILENECIDETVLFENGAEMEFTCNGAPGNKGDKYSSTITLQYRFSETEILHEDVGHIVTKLE